MKRIVFLGDALARLRDFPEGVRTEAGVQLHKVQQGLDPTDWKPMPSVAEGVREVPSAIRTVLFASSTSSRRRMNSSS